MFFFPTFFRNFWLACLILALQFERQLEVEPISFHPLLLTQSLCKIVYAAPSAVWATTGCGCNAWQISQFHTVEAVSNERRRQYYSWKCMIRNMKEPLCHSMVQRLHRNLLEYPLSAFGMKVKLFDGLPASLLYYYWQQWSWPIFLVVKERKVPLTFVETVSYPW